MSAALTKEKRDLIIAMSLGDGCLHNNGQLMISHSSAQSEYLYYKYSLLKSILAKPKERVYFHKQANKSISEYYTQSKRLKFIRILKKALYADGKKTLTRKFLNRIGLLGLAILWMDDGNRWIRYSEKKNSWDVSGRLFLCVNKEQSQLFIDFMKENYGIESYMLVKGRYKHSKEPYYTIMFNGRQLQKLSNLLRPYIIPSMEYKINPEIVGEDNNDKNPMICSYLEMIRKDEVGSTPLKAQLRRSAKLVEMQEDIVQS